MSTVHIAAHDADKPAEENPDPVGRAYYAFSTLLCTPALLLQDSLGAPSVPGLTGRGASAKADS